MGERNAELVIAQQKGVEEIRYHLIPALCVSNQSQKNRYRWRKSFRTKPCRYDEFGLCRYGKKCRFLHKRENKNFPSNSERIIKDFESGLEKKLEELQHLIIQQIDVINNQTLEIENLKKRLDHNYPDPTTKHV